MQHTEFRTGVISPVECVKEGFDLIKSDYWLLFAVWLVGALIGGFTMYILFGAMLCGIFIAYLKKIDGEAVAFEDLWKGMEYFGPGLIVTLAIVVPMLIVYFLAYASILAAVFAGAQMGEAGVMVALIGALAVDLVLVVIMVCFHTLLMFAFPLIVDRKLSGIEAMMTSARAVLKNLGGVTGLILVNFGLILLGYLALCIGVYFVIPIMLAGNVVAYRRVFPSLYSRAGFKPPPNSYQGP